MTLCDWRVKTGIVSVWVTGKTICDSFITHGPDLSALEIGHYKAPHKFGFPFLSFFPSVIERNIARRNVSGGGRTLWRGDGGRVGRRLRRHGARRFRVGEHAMGNATDALHSLLLLQHSRWQRRLDGYRRQLARSRHQFTRVHTRRFVVLLSPSHSANITGNNSWLHG